MIYFAQADGTDLVKIGYTGGDPAKRIGELQTGCPYKLVLLASIEGNEQREARWHKDFAADRVSGEWFKLTPRLILEIAREEAHQIARQKVSDLAGEIYGSPPPPEPGREWWPRFLGRCREMYPVLAARIDRVDAFEFTDGLLYLGFPPTVSNLEADACAAPASVMRIRWALEACFGKRRTPYHVRIVFGVDELLDTRTAEPV